LELIYDSWFQPLASEQITIRIAVD